MGRRRAVLLWGAAAAAVFFLGSVWTTAGRLGSGPHALANVAVLGSPSSGSRRPPSWPVGSPSWWARPSGALG